MILLFRVFDEKCDIEFSAGTVVVPIEDHLDCSNNLSPRSDYIAFMVSNGKIVRIRGISMTDVVTDDPTRNAPDPTRELWIFRDGSNWWFKNGRYHRNDGPAVEIVDGSKVWYKNGKRHRDDGPAIEREDGTKEWWKNGVKIN